MSHELRNDLGNMNRSILMNEEYLNRIIETQELSYEDANFLTTINGHIIRISSDYKRITTNYLKKADNHELSITFSTTASTFNRYFSMLETYHFNGNDTLTLNSKQLEQLKVMKEVTDIWVDIVKEHSEDLNIDATTEEKVQMFIDGQYNALYNENNLITKNTWVDLLKELSSNTEDYLKKEFTNINYDLNDLMSEGLYRE